MNNNNSSLTSANIKYLLSLNELTDGGKTNGIRCIEIANNLKVSKPSVHTMMSRLQELGFVNKDRYGTVFLTEKGYHYAGKYNHYFEIVLNHFRRILPRTVNAKMACYNFLSEIGIEDLAEMSENIILLDKSDEKEDI